MTTTTSDSPVTPSEFIPQANERIRGRKVWLLARVSSKPQKKNLPAYKEALKQVAKLYGCPIVGKSEMAECAWKLERPKLMKVFEKARKLGAVVLAFCVNRIVRNETRGEPDDWDLLRVRREATRTMMNE
jgi:DNA invertase Pin-like site-specific DNA recombinase